MLNFSDVPIGANFIDSSRQLLQKTSKRGARAGAGPVYTRRRKSLAFIVPNGTTCPLRKSGWFKETE